MAEAMVQTAPLNQNVLMIAGQALAQEHILHRAAVKFAKGLLITVGALEPMERHARERHLAPTRFS